MRKKTVDLSIKPKKDDECTHTHTRWICKWKSGVRKRSATFKKPFKSFSSIFFVCKCKRKNWLETSSKENKMMCNKLNKAINKLVVLHRLLLRRTQKVNWSLPGQQQFGQPKLENAKHPRLLQHADPVLTNCILRFSGDDEFADEMIKLEANIERRVNRQLNFIFFKVSFNGFKSIKSRSIWQKRCGALKESQKTISWFIWINSFWQRQKSDRSMGFIKVESNIETAFRCTPFVKPFGSSSWSKKVKFLFVKLFSMLSWDRYF